jgi:hypothetical protein
MSGLNGRIPGFNIVTWTAAHQNGAAALSSEVLIEEMRNLLKSLLRLGCGNIAIPCSVRHGFMDV